MASNRSSPNSLLVVMVTATVILVVFGATPSSAADRLNSGESLAAGQSLTNGNYRFVMQNDCNLVLYDQNLVPWSSKTYGKGSACRVTMERSGQLVIYNDGGTGIWTSSGSKPWGPYSLILQSDRNVVIYGNNGAVWATNTVR